MPNAAEKIKKTVQLDASTVEIEERGVKLRLTVVDTPGFGDAIDNTDSFQQIIRYIDQQFERYLTDESGLNRKNIVDNRVHCCFYFISPYGHGLKPLDIEVKIHSVWKLTQNSHFGERSEFRYFPKKNLAKYYFAPWKFFSTLRLYSI